MSIPGAALPITTYLPMEVMRSKKFYPRMNGKMGSVRSSYMQTAPSARRSRGANLSSLLFRAHGIIFINQNELSPPCGSQ